MTRPPVSLGKFLHFAVTGISAESVEAAVGDQQHVADGIRLLCGFNGFRDLELAALIFPVRQQDHGLAPNFFRQLVVRGQVDRIVEHGAFRG